MTLADATISPPTFAGPAVPQASVASPATVVPGAGRTIWGLDTIQLHTRYWASHGVQVVRQGEPSEIVKHAELFLLIETEGLALFKLGPLMEALNWVKPQVMFVRLHDVRE